MASGFYITSNESVNGRRVRIRTELLKLGWQDAVPALHPGSDYSWCTLHNKQVGVQSKTSLDFVLSFFSGLLQRELEELSANSDIPVLLLENWPMVDRQTGGARNFYGTMLQGNRHIPYMSFVHAFADTLAHSPGIYPIVTYDMKMTIDWLGKLGPAHFDKEVGSWDRPEITPRHKNKALQLMMAFDSLGLEKSKRLLREFGTVDGVLVALRNGLIKNVQGIGKGTITKMLEQLQERFSEGDN